MCVCVCIEPEAILFSGRNGGSRETAHSQQTLEPTQHSPHSHGETLHSQPFCVCADTFSKRVCVRLWIILTAWRKFSRPKNFASHKLCFIGVLCDGLAQSSAGFQSEMKVMVFNVWKKIYIHIYMASVLCFCIRHHVVSTLQDQFNL